MLQNAIEYRTVQFFPEIASQAKWKFKRLENDHSLGNADVKQRNNFGANFSSRMDTQLYRTLP
jgi:hypothetical protein